MRHLTHRFAQPGRLEAILLRPARDAPMLEVDTAEAVAGAGLVGDRSCKSTKVLGRSVFNRDFGLPGTQSRLKPLLPRLRQILPPPASARSPSSRPNTCR